MKSLKNFYVIISIITFNVIIFFILINIFLSIFYKSGLVYKRPPINDPFNEKLFLSPKSLYYKDINFLRNIYKDYSDADIYNLIYLPDLSNNSVLEYMEKPRKSKFYNIGFENIRYNKYVNESNASQVINGSTWVFGGSITFGYGVADDQTIPYYLNDLDSSNVYLNFGVRGYNQNIEINKLLLLLKKGYRPKTVIFIDCLNDITALERCNFDPCETPSRVGGAYPSFTIKNWLEAKNLRKIPLVDFIYEQKLKYKINQNKNYNFNKPIDIYSVGNLYHEDPITYYLLTNQFYFPPAKEIDTKLLSYYTKNSIFLDQLSKAFGFRCFIFVPPVGLLYSKNPFIKENPYYNFYDSIVSSLRNKTKDKLLKNFYDISGCDTLCSSSSYIDVNHYSPELCKIVARNMLPFIK